MKADDLKAVLKVGEAYYIGIRRPLAPKGSGIVVRFVEYLGAAPPYTHSRRDAFLFRFVDYETTAHLKPECIVQVGKTPLFEMGGTT